MATKGYEPGIGIAFGPADHRIRSPGDLVMVGDPVPRHDHQPGTVIALRRVGNRYFVVSTPDAMVDGDYAAEGNPK